MYGNKLVWILILIVSLSLMSCANQSTVNEEPDSVEVKSSQKPEASEPISIELPQDDTVSQENNSTNSTTPSESDDLVQTQVVLSDNMYIVKECALYSEPRTDSTLYLNLMPGRVAEILEVKDDWCHVEMYTLRWAHVDSIEIDARREFETVDGWLQVSNLGYYDALKSNIGLDVLIKKGHEPDWAQEFPKGLWGHVYEETENTFGLELYGASVETLNKSDIEPFFIQPNKNN